MPAAVERRNSGEQRIPQDPDLIHASPRPSASLLYEIYLPWIVGGGTCLLAYFRSGLWLLKADWEDKLLDRSIAACAVLVAYLLTAITILPALEEKTIIQRLRKWGYFDKFVLPYIARAVWAAGLLLILSFAATPFPKWLDDIPRFNQAYSSLWWGASAFTISSVFVATKILLKVVRAR